MIKNRFRAALALAGVSQQTWAKQHGVTYQAVYQHLLGKMTSRRLANEIEAFIRSEFDKVGVAA